jgi:hypothetical protein
MEFGKAPWREYTFRNASFESAIAGVSAATG